MFRKKNNQHSAKQASSPATIIGVGHFITGNIESQGHLRIDGNIKGNIHCKAKVLIGPAGQVEGSIDCQEADISGTVIGNVNSKGLLSLKGNASISGDIHTSKLMIEPTVSFNGQCHMGANIVELKTELSMTGNE
ncbi:MAG: polymer-forming cytoskeletal protein [Ferruginibacter sp.]